MEVIKNSLFCRFFAAIGHSIALGWKNSLIMKAADGLHESYEQSNTKKRLEGFMYRDDPADGSVWQRFLGLIERLLLWLGGILEQSPLYRALQLLRKFYFRVTEKSLVFGTINKLSLRRWLLLAFAMYLPMEYFFRDMLKINILASVWEELFIAAAACMVIWRTCLKRNDTFKRTSPVETAMLLFMVVGLGLMFLTRKYAYIGWAGLRAQVEYMVWFFLILRLCETKEDARFTIWAFAAVVFALSLHGCYQYVIGVPIPAHWTSQTEMSVRTRVFSITGSPNIFGSLLVLAAPTSAALIYYAKKPLWKLCFLCTTGIICLCDLFTFSRGSWVGLIVAIVIFAVFVDKRLFGFMGVAMAGILVAVPSIASRIAYLFTSDYSTASAAGGRSVRWKVGMTLLQKNSPLFGYGLGRFGGAVAMNNQVQSDIDYFYLDNYYLKTLVEMGYLGLAFFILLLLVLLVFAFRASFKAGEKHEYVRSLDPVVRNEGNDRLVCVGVLCGMCGVLTHCFFENIFEEPYMMAYFWGLAAAMIALPKALSKEERD